VRSPPTDAGILLDRFHQLEPSWRRAFLSQFARLTINYLIGSASSGRQAEQFDSWRYGHVWVV